MTEETDFPPLLGDRYAFHDWPWLVPPDVPEVVGFLRANGRPRSFAAHTVFPFGAHDKVWLITSGLLATCVGGFAEFDRMACLWSENAVLGGIRAVIRGGRSMNLAARMLSDVETVEVEGEVFRGFLEADPRLTNRVLTNYLLKNTAQMEGTLVNDLMPVKVRLAIVLCVLARAAGLDRHADSVKLPWPVTVQEFSLLIHSDRTVVGRILRDWEKSGAVVREGRFLRLDRTLREEIPGHGL
ncbi:hypothetical protein [Sutterella sp.]|uniref:hypothetical protein n=1 Tax=Sutterella sp. TaxID=1981025 RepID=UPI0026E013F8|nr:hypothetical protein [Sutterella sp.]MDO5532933.1 hypothetical protein [Sutterella sp.]